METASLIQLASLVGAAGSALVLLTGRRVFLLLGLAALLGAELALGLALVSADDVGHALAGPLRLGALAAVVVALAALAAGLLRVPAAVPVVLLAVAPFRIPVEVGAQKAFLLVPLYGALAASAAALAVRALRNAELKRLPLLLGAPATAFIALAALSSLWSEDVEASAVKLLFFYFPFAVLVAVAARAPLAVWTGRALVATMIVLGVGLAAVGLWQLRSENLFFARDLEVGNAYTTFFRTTSVFNDPSIYGRHLVLVLLVVFAALWLSRLPLLPGVALLAFVGAGLYFTYSQSSMLALAAGVLLVVLVAADPRSRTIVVAGALVPLAIAGVVLVLVTENHSVSRITSKRSDLVANAVEVTREHPVAGVGIGAETRAAEEVARAHPNRSRKSSHTTPLTVSAELGALGGLAYLLFLAGAARLLFLAHARDGALGLGLAAVFLALFVHSLFYSGFFEDPIAWLALAVAGALAFAPREAVAAAPEGESRRVERPALATEQRLPG
jgi:hypothetical protein